MRGPRLGVAKSQASRPLVGFGGECLPVADKLRTDRVGRRDPLRRRPSITSPKTHAQAVPRAQSPLDSLARLCYSIDTSKRGFFFCALLSEGGRDVETVVSSLDQNQFYGGADMRVKIVLACTECKQRNYLTKKNKKNDPDRLEMNKYCRFCRKHTLHRETK